MTDVLALKAPMLTDWTSDKRRRFRRKLVTFQHRLLDIGLFSDVALAKRHGAPDVKLEAAASPAKGLQRTGRRRQREE